MAGHLSAPRCRCLFRSYPTTRIAPTNLQPQSARHFSQSPALLAEGEADREDGQKHRVRGRKTPTRLRRRMYIWMNQYGRQFRDFKPGELNYLSKLQRKIREEKARRDAGKTDGDEGEGEGENDRRVEDRRPFPLNRNFHSENVLSEDFKRLIYKKVVHQGQSVSAVSVELGVDMRRVAAVVRLMEVEKKWEAEGKSFATQYASAVMAMLPQTNVRNEKTSHEPINDLPVHPATLKQIFYPTSESRAFTREDAARVFSDTLLPADKRIPHPEMIEASRPEHQDLNPTQRKRIAEKVREEAEKRKAEIEQKKADYEKRRTIVVERAGSNFRFQRIDADAVDKTGRDPNAVGWRYGMPHEDRKRGHVKDIPPEVVT